jgi:ABC-type branched-subunit amino acid transport system substrate-binding protein
MARRHVIGAFCAFALIAAGCGRDSDSTSSSETTAPAAAPTTVAPAGDTETTAAAGGTDTTAAPETTEAAPADPCEGATLEATEVGVSESEITITVMADTGSPLAPGLFQGNIDAVKAFAEAVNADGGLGCRQLVVEEWDSKLDPTESKNGLIQACGNSVAMVGSNALFNPDVSPLVDCADMAGAATGLPDLAALANDINQQCNATTYLIQGVSEPCTSFEGVRDLKAMIGPAKYYTSLEPDLHGIYLVPGDLPTTVQSATYQIKAMEQVGVKWDATLKISGRDEQAAYTPRIAAAAAANATFVYNGSNDKAMYTMRKEAAAQGLDSVKIWGCSLACYTKSFIPTGGEAVEGTYVWMQFIPFEEADLNEEATAYVNAIGADNVNSFGAQAWQAAVLFKQVVDQIVADQGPNGITRAAILETLAATEEFTANGWMAPKDLRGFSECFAIMQVQDQEFKRVYPEEPGTFDCDPSNIVTLTMDPAVEAASIG